MKRSSLLKLREPQWIKVIDNDPLEVKVVPSESRLLVNLLVSQTDDAREEVCKRTFIDFKHYTNDDGTPVENTLEARLELLAWPPVFMRINTYCSQTQSEAAEGEGDAA